MSIYEFLEDWDDDSLAGYEWDEQMENAIEDFYFQYPPDGDKRKMKNSSIISNYKSWKREKYAPEM